MFGRVLVVGGNDGMIRPRPGGHVGSRVGSGLVQSRCRGRSSALTAITPELIGLGLGKAAGKDQLLEAAEKADAVVIGPGLGQTPEAEGRLTRLVRLDKPMVVDADGLNLLSKMKRWPTWFKARAVLTPHPGEMARLGKLIGRTDVPADEPGRIGIRRRPPRRSARGAVKGYGTSSPTAARVTGIAPATAPSPKPAPATSSAASSALLGQDLDPFDAAVPGRLAPRPSRRTRGQRSASAPSRATWWRHCPMPSPSANAKSPTRGQRGKPQRHGGTEANSTPALPGSTTTVRPVFKQEPELVLRRGS